MSFKQITTVRKADRTQRPALALKFKIIPAPEKLKQVVECFRVAEYIGQDRLAIKVSLNGLPGIVFQHNQGQSPVESIITPSRRNSRVPILYIYGQQTEPSVMNHTGSFTMTQAILKPHALKTLFGMNASTLTDSLAELSEFSARDLNLQLIEAKNEQERIALLTNFLWVQLQQKNTRDRLVEESLNLIHKDTGAITVRYLLEHLNISERQFERRFKEGVGISPQFYIRVKRFNKAVKLIKTNRFDRLTDVAYALNFYDQSHFIRDVKAFSGITPNSLSQKEDDYDHGQAGYSFV